jgi:hypothetical protein
MTPRLFVEPQTVVVRQMHTRDSQTTYRRQLDARAETGRVQEEGQMPAYVTPYETIDAAALAGFQRILRNNLNWQSYEYGFLVFERSHDIVRQLGHEGFMDTAMRYFYTEPHTDQSRSSIGQSISPAYAMSARAFCHTHPTPGTFSSADFRGFKKLKELTGQHKVRYDIVYYLMESNRQIRRSSRENNFFEGDLMPGLDKAVP